MNAPAFKDLCLDAVVPALAAEFWGPTLGLQVQPREDEELLLTDGTDTHRVWVNRVPEARSVKQRVHLDVHVADVAELTARGARVLDDTLPWTLLADPEGGEFCGFVRPAEDLGGYRLYELVVDATDPATIARWWADRLDVGVGDDDENGFSWLDPGAGLPWEVVFQRVPEPKTVKNRIHFDVWGDAADFLAAGARLLRARDAEIDWDVLADPDGNEFCVFARP